MLLFRLIAGALLAVFIGGSALAERRVALVVGNADYVEASDLVSPADDARLMTEMLENIGFEVTQVIDADQSQMKRAILEFGRELREGVDVSLFYYAGHGSQAAGRSYLVPVDAGISDELELDLLAVGVDGILRLAEASSADINIVVLDAGRGNPFVSGAQPEVLGMALADAPEDTYIAYAASPGEFAQDGTTGNSPYTAALAEAISQPGMSIEAAFERVSSMVMDVTNGRQAPWNTSNLTSDIQLSPAEAQQPSAATTADAEVATAWAAIQNSTNIGDYEAFIAAFGSRNEFLRSLAESRISALDVPSTGTGRGPGGKLPETTGSLAVVPQIGHSDWIRELDWSRDGRHIVSASDDFTLRIWDVATGGVLRILAGHSDWVRGVDWSNDGQNIVSAGRDGVLIIWDAQTGESKALIESEQSGLLSVAWSPDDAVIAVGGYSGVELRDGASGELLQKLDGHSDWVRSVAWSPDGGKLASGSDDGTAIIWNVAAGGVLQKLEGHSEYVKSVAWSPDGRLVATGSDDKFVKIWDAATGTLNHTLGEFEDAVESVAWSPKGGVLATSDNRSGAKFWDDKTGRLLHSMEEDYQSVQHLDWSPDGLTLASGGSDRDVELWDPETGARQAKFAALDLAGQHMALSPDGISLAVVFDGNNINLWDMTRGEFARRVTALSGSLETVVWSPDGAEIAVGGSSQNVGVVSARTGELRLDLGGHEDWVRAIAWSPDGGQLVSVGDDNRAIVWNAATGARKLTLTGHTDWIFAAAWSPDGRLIATGANDGDIRLWNAANGELERTIVAEGNPRQLLFSSSSAELVSVDGSQSVTTWNVNDGRRLSQFTVDGGALTAIAWAPDERFLVAGGHVLDADGRSVAKLGTGNQSVTSVFWSSDVIGTLEAGPSLVIWDTGAYQRQMTLFFGVNGDLGILYPDGTAYAPAGARDFFALVENGEFVQSAAGGDELFRSQPLMPR